MCTYIYSSGSINQLFKSTLKQTATEHYYYFSVLVIVPKKGANIKFLFLHCNDSTNYL